MSRNLSAFVVVWAALASLASAQRSTLVEDIYPGTSASGVAEIVDVDGVVFFRAEEGVNGLELWKSDGTAAGTMMVKDIYPGPTNSFPSDLVNANGILYFSANDGVNGRELWKSDGTAAGTVMVKDINPGSSGSSPSDLAAYGSKVLFSANVSPTGGEPWISDGTAAGTFLLADVCPGSCSSLPRDGVVLGGKMYFGVYTGAAIYETDGTPAGTVLVKSISGASSPPSKLTRVGGTIFFEAFGPGAIGYELYKTDGTTAGTVLVKDINPSGYSSPNWLTNVNGTLFFSARDGTNGVELWKSDGTAAGTVMVKDIRPGFGNSSPEWLAAVKDTVFFAASDAVNGTELWQSDGTAAGTVVRDIRPGSSSSDPSSLLAVNDTLLFQVYEGNVYGDELYKTSVTMPGIRLVDDIRRGFAASSPSLLTRSGSYVFFSADDGVAGRELRALKVDDLHFLTVTSTDSQNELEWVNPMDGALQIRFRTDTYPMNELDGTALPIPGGPGDTRQSHQHAATNGTTYYYRGFVDDGVNVVSDRKAKGRPQITSGDVKWVYNTGATTMTPPSISSSIYVASNDTIVHSMDPDTGLGGTWPAPWLPFAMAQPAQQRAPVIPIPVGKATRVVFVGSQDGHVYAVDADSGEYVWRSENLGFVQAAPAGTFIVYGSSFDLLMVGTRVSGAPNSFNGISVNDGDVSWSFDNGGGGSAIGLISSGAAVDRAAGRVYFTSRGHPTGSDRTVWCLSFSQFGRTLEWARGDSDPTPIADTDAGPGLRGATLYVGTNDSKLHALDKTSGADLWTTPFDLADGAVKAYVWPTFGSSELLLSTNTTVWAFRDDGTDATELWSTNAVPSPSAPVRRYPYVYVGGGDGRLYEIDIAVGPASLKSLPLGDLAPVGAPSLHVPSGILYVGSDSGAIYAVQIPFP